MGQPPRGGTGLYRVLLRVEQDGDFAFVLDGDGEVGGVVVVEVAGGDGEAALVLDRVMDPGGGRECTVAFAIEDIGVFRLCRTAHVQLAVEIEVGNHANTLGLVLFGIEENSTVRRITVDVVDAGFARSGGLGMQRNVREERHDGKKQHEPAKPRGGN